MLAILLGSTAFDSFSAMPQSRNLVDDLSGSSTAVAVLLRTTVLLFFATGWR